MAGLLLAAGATGCVLRSDGIGSKGQSLEFRENRKYTLYIGVNSKDNLKPMMTLADAKVLISAICLQYTDGFTVTEAEGVWTDPEGRLTREDIVVCIFMNISEERLVLIMNEILRDLNQLSILVEKTAPGTAFYYAPDSGTPP